MTIKNVFLTLILASLTGCAWYLRRPDSYYIEPGTQGGGGKYYSEASVSPSALTPGKYTLDHRGSIHVDATISGGGTDTIVQVDTTVIRAVMLYNGFLVLPRNILGDTISRVWLQWDEGGPWLPYDLPDSLNR